MSEKKKLFVLTFPVISHLNAIVNVINDLVQMHNYKVVTYGLKIHEKMLLKTGSEFRRYENYFDVDKSQIDATKTRIETLAPLINNFLTLANTNLIKIAIEIDLEKPDMIVFDAMAIHAKWIIRYLNKNYKQFLENKNAYLLTTSAAPKVLVYYTGFANQKNIFPDKNEEKDLFSGTWLVKFFSFFSILKVFIRTKILSIKFGLDFVNPIQDMLMNDLSYKQIVFTIPEIQPRAILMHKNIIFIGSIFSERLRIKEQRLTDDTSLDLRTMIEKFDPINPTEKFENLINKNNNRLLYCSFGTVFESGTKAYLKVIEAINLFNNQSVEEMNKKGIKINKLNVIMSVGKICYKELERIFKLDNHSLPKEIVIVPSAPQIEILKRASLFLTHTGFGSMHESLYFGVPMIAMPIAADQPFNARYLENELKACVSVNFRCPNSIEIKNAIEKILIIQKYHQACLKFSKLLKDSDGAKNGGELIDSLILNKL